MRSRIKEYWHQYIRNKTVKLYGITIPIDYKLMNQQTILGIESGEYEQEEANACFDVVNSVDRVLEIGAGIGFISSICAQICGSENVLCYEANPGLEDLILRTHELNAVSPRLRMRAIAPAAGNTSFYVNEDIVSSGILDKNVGTRTIVQADVLSEVLTEWCPNVLIVDIEGAEINLLGTTDLSIIDLLIVEFHPRIVGEKAIDALIAKLTQSGLNLYAGDPGGVAQFKRDLGSITQN